MGQVTIYLDKKTEDEARRAAKQSGKFLSRWIAEAVQEKARDEWPEALRGLIGSAPDFPDADSPRSGPGKDAKRLGLLMHVLDTNTVSSILRGEGWTAKKLLAVRPSRVSPPSVVVYEIDYGIARSRHKERLSGPFHEFCKSSVILPFGLDAARSAAAIRTELEELGTPIGPHDLLIASTCMAAGGTLITHNTKKFSRVRGLRLKDWY
jgi:tRNA(fMet)-specific endonuclease VapC